MPMLHRRDSSRQGKRKARIGIEPMYKGFADPRLTTWLPRRDYPPPLASIPFLQARLHP